MKFYTIASRQQQKDYQYKQFLVWDFNDLQNEHYEFSDNSIVAIDIIASDGSNF